MSNYLERLEYTLRISFGISLSILLLFLLGGCTKYTCPPEEKLATCKELNVETNDNNIKFIGPEDITIDHEKGIAYISIDPRKEVNQAIKENVKLENLPQGAIFVLNLKDLKTNNDKPVQVKNLTSNYSMKKSFHPHGIFLHIDEATRQRYLFVVNHKYKKVDNKFEQHNEILRFSLKNNHLYHSETYHLKEMSSPNDVAVIDKNKILVTNSSKYSSQSNSWKFIVDQLFGYRTGKVVLLDKSSKTEKTKIIMDGLQFANGINIQKLHQKDEWNIFVSDSKAGEIRQIKFSTNHIINEKKTGELILGSLPGVDNIEWDEESRLYIARSPSLLRFILYSTCKVKGGCGSYFKIAPSVASRVDMNTDFSKEVPIYCNDGTELSSSSVAAVHKGIMLIGSVFENKLVVCRNLPDSKNNIGRK